MIDEEKRAEAEELITKPELRLGYAAALYYNVLNRKLPKQLDLLEEWFPGMIIRTEETDGTEKRPPEYIDTERMIHAVRYHNYIYSGGNNRVTHITGKLTGTASSNLEKERKTAELIQKNIARRLVSEMNPVPDLHDHMEKMIDALDEEQTDTFHYILYMYVLMCADRYREKKAYERDEELFPFDEEVIEQVLYNALYQLVKYDWDGLVNAWMWLMLGSLLRNECGRVTRVYDSSFVPVNRAPGSEDGLFSRLRYLIAPEQYENYYAGDDLDRQFPGTEWYCDECGGHLNEQPGFDDHLPAWQCRRCGHINPINFDRLYETREDWLNDIHTETREQFEQTIEKRRAELKAQEEEKQEG